MISLIIRNADIVFVFICISQLCTCAAFFLLNILQHSACNTFWIYWEEEKNKTNHATLCGFQWLCLFFFTSLWLGLKVVCLKMLFFGQIGNGTSMFLLSLLRLVVAVFFFWCLIDAAFYFILLTLSEKYDLAFLSLTRCCCFNRKQNWQLKIITQETFYFISFSGVLGGFCFV